MFYDERGCKGAADGRLLGTNKKKWLPSTPFFSPCLFGLCVSCASRSNGFTTHRSRSCLPHERLGEEREPPPTLSLSYRAYIKRNRQRHMPFHVGCTEQEKTEAEEEEEESLSRSTPQRQPKGFGVVKGSTRKHYHITPSVDRHHTDRLLSLCRCGSLVMGPWKRKEYK